MQTTLHTEIKLGGWLKNVVRCFACQLSVCLLQLVDFLDVIDDPILGYTAPAVITVLHTHLATCAVDYRYVLYQKKSVVKW